MLIDSKATQRFYTKINPNSSGCWEWVGAATDKGYGRFKLNGKLELSHRVSYLIHYGVDPKDLHVCHKCDNPKCVRPSHLFLGTRSDNMKDCGAKGRVFNYQTGTRKLAKYNLNEIVAAVNELGLKGAARKFGCSFTTVGDFLLENGIAREYNNGRRTKIAPMV